VSSNQVKTKKDLVFFQNKPFTGIVYHKENGKLKFEYELKNGLKNGLHIEYQTSDSVFLYDGNKENIDFEDVKKLPQDLRDIVIHKQPMIEIKEKQIKTIRSFKDNNLHGVFEQYWANEKLRFQTEYINDKRNGKEIDFYMNGEVDTITTLKDDLKNGAYFKYREGGNLKVKTFYKDDKTHGRCEIYYESGLLENVGDYKDGKLEGVWKYYFENGKLSSSETYKDGVRNGFAKIYDQDTGAWIEGNFEDAGKRYGSWKTYDENGQFVKKEIYINDELASLDDIEVVVFPTDVVELRKNKKGIPLDTLVPELKFRVEESNRIFHLNEDGSLDTSKGAGARINLQFLKNIKGIDGEKELIVDLKTFGYIFSSKCPAFSNVNESNWYLKDSVETFIYRVFTENLVHLCLNRIIALNNIDYENTIPNRPTEHAWKGNGFIIEFYALSPSTINDSPSHFGPLYNAEIEKNNSDGTLAVILITEGIIDFKNSKL
jgi:antitoxin component YwqK of YwqJK toxin-antitoxin module